MNSSWEEQVKAVIDNAPRKEGDRVQLIADTEMTTYDSPQILIGNMELIYTTVPKDATGTILWVTASMALTPLYAVDFPEYRAKRYLKPEEITDITNLPSAQSQ